MIISSDILIVSFETPRKEIDMNKNRLEYEMKEKNISKDQMCKLLNMSRSAFYRKCNGKSEFTQSEIQKILELLELDSPMGIFFTLKVS